jgi:hypothetical protein
LVFVFISFSKSIDIVVAVVFINSASVTDNFVICAFVITPVLKLTSVAVKLEIPAETISIFSDEITLAVRLEIPDEITSIFLAEMLLAVKLEIPAFDIVVFVAVISEIIAFVILVFVAVRFEIPAETISIFSDEITLAVRFEMLADVALALVIIKFEIPAETISIFSDEITLAVKLKIPAVDKLEFKDVKFEILTLDISDFVALKYVILTSINVALVPIKLEILPETTSIFSVEIALDVKFEIPAETISIFSAEIILAVKLEILAFDKLEFKDVKFELSIFLILALIAEIFIILLDSAACDFTLKVSILPVNELICFINALLSIDISPVNMFLPVAMLSFDNLNES